MFTPILYSFYTYLSSVFYKKSQKKSNFNYSFSA
nr:MAG TPA: hypothetical protein [Caudoviricetes sp.]